MSSVLEADLKDLFGSLDPRWLLRIVEHRVRGPRVISLIRHWLKAGVLEDGVMHSNDEETPRGGPIGVLLSNVHLHYVLDLWFERLFRPRLRGDAYLVRYIDDFVVCFQYREDVIRVQRGLRERLAKFGLALEPTKTAFVEFGRFTQRYAPRRGGRPGTIYFPGFMLYCTRTRRGKFQDGIPHGEVPTAPEYYPPDRYNATRASQRLQRFVKRYWRKMLSSQSRKGSVS